MKSKGQSVRFGNIAAWPHLLEVQRERETRSVDEGVRRYKEDVASARRRGQELDTPPGVRMMVEVLPALESAIRDAQEQATKLIREGNPETWCWPILYLRADKLAVITLRTVMGGDYETPVTTLAVTIANHARHEREYEMWRQAEKRKTELDNDAVNVYNLLRRSVRKVNQRVARAWMRRSQTFEPVNWTVQQKMSLGSVLLQLLVWNGRGWFEFTTLTRKTPKGAIKSQSTVRLTELARGWLNEQHDIVAEWRPWLTPMVVPPLRWEREPDELVSCAPE